MLHKAWNSKEEMPYCFSWSSIKFQGHTGQNITDFDPNWAFPDYRPVAAFKSLRFALFYKRMTISKCFAINMRIQYIIYDIIEEDYIYRWLSARLQYLQYVSNGDTAVVYLAIDIVAAVLDMSVLLQWSYNDARLLPKVKEVDQPGIKRHCHGAALCRMNDICCAPGPIHF